MAELFIIVAIILLVFLSFLIFTFFSFTSVFLNIIAIISLYIFIKRGLKDEDNAKYYIAALPITALFFIYSTSGFMKGLLLLAERMMLSDIVLAAALVYVFANIIALAYEFSKCRIMPYLKR